MVSILGMKQPKSKPSGVKFSESGSVKKKGILRSKLTGDKENGLDAVALAKGRSNIYDKLRTQIELLESDQNEARKKIEELELEEEKLLQGSEAVMVEMNQKFATVEEGLKYQIVALKTENAEQQMVIDEKNIELAEKNDQLMCKDEEIEELKEQVKRINDRLVQAAKSLAW